MDSKTLLLVDSGEHILQSKSANLHPKLRHTGKPANEVRTQSEHAEHLLKSFLGGQYDCGTTDVTRTFHMGEPSEHQKMCFSRVLQVKNGCSTICIWLLLSSSIHLCTPLDLLPSSLACCLPKGNELHQSSRGSKLRRQARMRACFSL